MSSHKGIHPGSSIPKVLTFHSQDSVEVARHFCRYFAESAATLACMVFGVRDGIAADAAPTRNYWITDGWSSVCCLKPKDSCLSMKAVQYLLHAA